MLDYSRNTRAEIIIEPIDFRYIIEDCFSDLEYVPHFKEVNKIINIYGEGVVFNSDVFRLKTVFINLISNSIKYRNPLSNFSHIKIKVTILPGNTEIRIYDNGIGIKNEHLPKIFDMFYRATNKSDGSGLGMYIVKSNCR